MIERLPDFLIVGAAKCGTTSLAKYLEAHESVFIPEKKEPKYFTYDLLKKDGYRGKGDLITKKVSVSSFEDYKKLFKKAKTNQIIGEASVDTLYYYKKTIPKIKEEIGDPKIIILLRNPVNRAVSAYSHLIRDERETKSFEEGLALEKERLAQGYEYIWGYKKTGCYSASVASFITNFKNVKVIFFEDFVENPKETVYDTLAFLGIRTAHIFNEGKHNVSGAPKNKMLNRFLNKPSFLKNLLKKLLTSDTGLKIKNKLQEKNLDKIKIDIAIKQHLQSQFLHEINSLEELLDRDLTSWKSAY